jgi:hypothetical protein
MMGSANTRFSAVLSRGAAVLGFSSMEFVVMIRDDGAPPVTKTARFQSFKNFVPMPYLRPLLLVKHRILRGTHP